LTLKRFWSGLLCGVLLVACLRQQTPEPTVLTWWITYAQDSAEYPAFQSIAEAFEKQTGVGVKLVSVAWSDIAPRGYGNTRLMQAQKEGNGPDLWGPLPHNWTAAFVAEGQVRALERTQIDNALQYLETALWSCQVEETQYGLPVLFDSIALIYNKALLAVPPKSMDELLALARAHTDPAQDRWGLVLPLVGPYHTYPFIEGYGGYAFRCERNQCDINDIGLNNEGAVRGIQLLSDLYVKQKLFPEPLIDGEVMNEYALNLFTAGRAAMLIDGPWVEAQIRAAGIDYGVAPIPPMPGATRAPRPFTLFQTMYISAYTAHPDETIALVNYIAGPEGVQTLQKALGRVPVRRDILRSATFRNNEIVQGWYTQAIEGVPLPALPEMESLWYPWGYALQVAVPGLVPVQDALDQAVNEFKSYFKK